MTKQSLLLLLLLIMFITSMIAPHVGYTSGGEVQGGFSADNATDENFVSWTWESIEFFWNMTTFQIDNMPMIIQAMWTIMSLMTGLLIVLIVRGN